MLKQFKTPKFEGNVFFINKYFSDKTIANKKKKLV